jgi:hypothetical protein
MLVEPGPPQISLQRQCTLLGLARCNWYDQAVGARAKKAELVQFLDERYIAVPSHFP